MLNLLLELPIYKEVIELFIEQQEKGYDKYGELLTLESHTVIDLIEHSQQECLDNLVYLQGIKLKLLGETKNVD